MTSWSDEAKVQEYVGRIGRLEARQAGERELVEALPQRVHRAVDLGCGDGQLISLILDARPTALEVLGLDSSPPMLALARQRFSHDARVTIEAHDLNLPLPELVGAASAAITAGVDVVVSGFAIHHLRHERKRSLFAEIVGALRPGGVFANLEIVQCATPELDAEFHRRIGRPGGDPEDVLACVEPQLEWMRDAGLVQVDCNWRWRGMALLVGQKPA